MIDSPNSRLIIRRPDDWHIHVRDGDMMAAVVPYTARIFSRAIIMPNLSPPITTVDAAMDYRARIEAVAGPDFQPLITAYLTDDTDPNEIGLGHNKGVFTAAKLYPANATTGSAHGVTDIERIYPALEKMQEIGMPLLIHGEVTDTHVDIFDREAAFIDRTLIGLVRDFPALKIVFEHITTQDAVDFVDEQGPNMAATITPQHLHINRNAMFAGGIRPHMYCLPVAKREVHRLALRRAATSGSPKYFLGTDSAPHEVDRKESACGCAGIFNAAHALESYATVFDQENALDKLEGFASVHGPKFYGLPLNEGTVTLIRSENPVPEKLVHGDVDIVPFHAGETLGWKVI
jgi:dihydroorotase